MGFFENMYRSFSISGFYKPREMMLLVLFMLCSSALNAAVSGFYHPDGNAHLTPDSGNVDLSHPITIDQHDEPTIMLQLYPQFSFRNSRLDRFYRSQLNINPTLHLQLWRGAEATAQVIIPLYNDYSTEESRIRPGFLTLSQQLDLPAGIRMMATVGNFSTQRTGGDLKLFRLLAPNLGMYAQAGLTYWTFPLFDRWISFQSHRISWRFGGNYFLESAGLLFNANVSQYLDNDIALRGEVVRYFKKASVGFYLQTLQYEGYSLNGGFFFAIALPAKKRSITRNFIVGAGDDFSLEYVARPYAARGVYYRTSPAENSSHNFFNNFLLNRYDK